MAYMFIQDYYNDRLAKVLKRCKVKKFRLVNVGNSIATGYSLVDKPKPLLDRNPSLNKVMNYHGIEYEPFNYTRGQNNSDEHVLDWLVSNTKESRIYDINRRDYTLDEICMANSLSDKEIDNYYPQKVVDDLGFQDALLGKEDNLANVVIYNGATGSFIDGVTRGGNIKQKLLHGVKRDITSIEAILKWIQIHNRKGDSNTQVYLCGAPNIIGIKANEIINHYLKKIAKNYANVTYIEPINSKLFYRKNGKIVSDIHYDEDEYFDFINHIISEITDNYDINKAMINLDREFYQYSRGIELYFPEMNKDDIKEKFMERAINNELCDVRDKTLFLKKLKQYIKRRYPYDFYYLGKESVNNSFSRVKKERH